MKKEKLKKKVESPRKILFDLHAKIIPEEDHSTVGGKDVPCTEITSLVHSTSHPPQSIKAPPPPHLPWYDLLAQSMYGGGHFLS